MLETILVILLIMWLLGMISSYILGGALHFLLLAVLIMFVIRIIQTGWIL